MMGEECLELVDIHPEVRRHQGCHPCRPVAPGIPEPPGKGKALLDCIVPFDHLALFAPELLAEQLHGQHLLRRPGMEVAHAADESVIQLPTACRERLPLLLWARA